MRLIFLYGLPATGKHTVAQHLATLTGYKLFHNHLAVDLLLSVFDFGTQPFVDLREQIWLSVFEQAAATNLRGLIFTFAPERTVRPTFIPDALDLLARHNATVDFIELRCPLPELKQRLDNPSRQRFQKLTSVALFDQLRAKSDDIKIKVTPMWRRLSNARTKWNGIVDGMVKGGLGAQKANR